jgi:secondary thiamine-phosphate synthase enzyme
MQQLTISSSEKKQIVDITQKINSILQKESFKNGFVILFLTHTTAALTTADLDPGTDLDMLDAFEEMIPKLRYRHPHDPSHVGDHIMSSIIGPSVIVPVKNSKLVLGTWQRVVLVEFNGPRERTILVNIFKK